MPAIRNCSDLVNNFNEIIDFCQIYREPVFLTNNGQGKLAVMSIEAYEELAGKLELYKLLDVFGSCYLLRSRLTGKMSNVY